MSRDTQQSRPQPRPRLRGDRAEFQLVDVALTFFVLVALLVTAPFYYTFIAMVDGVADPFSAMLLQLLVPMLFIGLVISAGVSARRGS